MRNHPEEPTGAAVRRPSAADVEEMLARTLAAPAVDPGQMPTGGRPRLDSGEMRLALAVLEDALRCVLRHHRSAIAEQRQAAREALQWMKSDDDAPPFTFVRVCQLFDLDPDWIRASVQSRLADGRVRRTPDEPARDAA